MKTLYNLGIIALLVIAFVPILVLIPAMVKGSYSIGIVCAIILAVIAFLIRTLNRKIKALSPETEKKPETGKTVSVSSDGKGHVTATIDVEAAIKKAVTTPGKVDKKYREGVYSREGRWDYREQEYPVMLAENYRITYRTMNGGTNSAKCKAADYITRNFYLLHFKMQDDGDNEIVAIPFGDIISLHDKVTGKTIDTPDVAAYIRAQNKKENARYRR